MLPILILAGGTIASLAMQAFATNDQISKPTVVISQPKQFDFQKYLPFIVIAIIAIILFGVLK